ncbi:unnamed protein product [Mytilus edulis]|uniref:WSC domain-containing protein n=1 Tax=Mytilus edulis TaxID=6550 RepID=A0A8S3SPU4_MYTED|nr:unnamed protein product [Mytilus edulis]
MKNLIVLALCLVSVVYSNPYRNSGLYRGYVGCFVDDRNHLMLRFIGNGFYIGIHYRNADITVEGSGILDYRPVVGAFVETGNRIGCVAARGEIQSIKFDFVGKESQTAYYRSTTSSRVTRYVECFVDDINRMLKHRRNAGSTVEGTRILDYSTVVGAFVETGITAQHIPKHRNYNAIRLVKGNLIGCVAGLGEMPSMKKTTSLQETMKNLMLLIFCLISAVNSNPYRKKGHYKGYVGCYVDDANRLLKYRVGPLHRITLEKCRHHCRGFRYLGLQYRDWCLCGNHLNSPAYPQASELQCNMPCTGENSRMCGGGDRNSIYHV